MGRQKTECRNSRRAAPCQHLKSALFLFDNLGQKNNVSMSVLFHDVLFLAVLGSSGLRRSKQESRRKPITTKDILDNTDDEDVNETFLQESRRQREASLRNTKKKIQERQKETDTLRARAVSRPGDDQFFRLFRMKETMNMATSTAEAKRKKRKWRGKTAQSTMRAKKSEDTIITAFSQTIIAKTRPDTRY